MSRYILDERPSVAVNEFLARCRQIGADVSTVRKTIVDGTGDLQRRWYAGLDRGTPDWDVYNVDEYLAEAWDCWATYSRKYLRELRKPGVMPDGRSAVASFSPQRVVDLGCGIGYSTAGLRSLWPAARVVGTNVPDAHQTRLARLVAIQHRFEIDTSGVESVGNADIVFASEYFEHFQAPIDHLRDVARHIRPAVMIIANAFTNPAVGHFPSYDVDGEVLVGSQASRAFNGEMHKLGFYRVKAKMWNNRPSIWRAS